MTGRTVNRCGFWVDTYRGEPVAYKQMLMDLAEVDVVYLGEHHTLTRHHELQHKIIADLLARDRPLVLGLEQVEAFNQPALDRYNCHEITFEQLSELIDWPSRWGNYQDYQKIVKAVHHAGGTIVGLNARQEIIRKVGRWGIQTLSGQERNELPDQIDTANEKYRQHLNNTMMVMAHVKDIPEMLDRMFTAQVCRDEMMAEKLFQAINNSNQPDPLAVVLCGSGHVSYGAGIPFRLKRRSPNVEDRIIILSGSGDVVLSKKMQTLSRDISITHQQLKCFDIPIADYLHVVNLEGHLDNY